MSKTKPCDQCPWRLANQGRAHPFKFYTAANLRRLWNQLRGADRSGRTTAQSCHLTDPSHPDHVAVGAKPGATAQECPGSVIVIVRELRRIEAAGEGQISTEGVKRYHAARRRGLTKRGILYWAGARVQFANVPMFGDKPLPAVDEHDPEIGLPEALRDG